MAISYRRCRPTDWMPGLFHGELTIGEVHDTLPGVMPTSIPWIVRFFENPSSPWSLLGAINLFRHDCMHILLGRGLNSEDEAFVLGFTMGQSDGVENAMSRLLRGIIKISSRHMDEKQLRKTVRNTQIAMFRFVAHYLYPSTIRMTKNDVIAYDLGLGLGETSPKRNIELFSFEDNRHRTVDELRSEFGINILKLEALYRVEQILSPGGPASRLDIDQGGIDHARITEPP
jgi:hypothetical protein